MDHVRQVIDSDKLSEIFNLPHSLRGRKVEVIILPIQEITEPILRKGSSFGSLQRYADPSLVAKEKSAWEMAVASKHAKS